MFLTAAQEPNTRHKKNNLRNIHTPRSEVAAQPLLAHEHILSLIDRAELYCNVMIVLVIS